jgi:acetyl esterase/lipase
MKRFLNVPFKQVEGRMLSLDIHMPDAEKPPLIMWIHGGGWKELNRTWNLAMPLVERGYAVASVDYRYSDEGAFPTQMYDLKDALLFLKRHAGEYGYDASKVAVSGDSAGGHLCCLMGVSAGNRDWETEAADYSVQAVIVMCGPTMLPLTFEESGAEPDDVIDQLLGAPVKSKAGLGKAAAASPLTYIDGHEPPFLILHGTDDPLVSPRHSRLLRNALETAGTPVMMHLIPGAVHGFGGKIVTDIMAEFLDYYLKGRTTVDTPVVEKRHERDIPYRST